MECNKVHWLGPQVVTKLQHRVHGSLSLPGTTNDRYHAAAAAAAAFLPPWTTTCIAVSSPVFVNRFRRSDSREHSSMMLNVRGNPN